jgi:hypothetical protein
MIKSSPIVTTPVTFTGISSSTLNPFSYSSLLSSDFGTKKKNGFLFSICFTNFLTFFPLLHALCAGFLAFFCFV